MASTTSKSSRAGPAIPISIVRCQDSDVPTLARIAATSMAADLLHRALYPSNNPLDVTPQQNNQERELSHSLRNPDARVFKAVALETGETVGYALLRFEGGQAGKDGAPADSTSTSAAATSNTPPTATTSEQQPQRRTESAASSLGPPPGANAKLISALMTGIRAVHSRVLGHVRHVWWTSLMVLPSYQRKGIGTALMRHGFEELGADALPIWLVTQVRGRDMYRTLGFEDVDVVDVDFSEYVGKYKGFGVHRNICMIRQPGGVASSEPWPTIKW